MQRKSPSRAAARPRGARKPVLRTPAKCPTGVRGLDEITGGGFPRGRPTLVCGDAGCGKTLLATEFLIRGAVELGEPGAILTFDESAEELASDAASLGHDIAGLVARKLLVIDHVRIELANSEESGDFTLDRLFFRLEQAVERVKARRVVLDSIETLFSGFRNDAIIRAELRRLFLWLKDRQLTAVITAERGSGPLTRHGIEEYIADCVILLDHRVSEQLATRRLRVVKYRGSQHGTNEYPFLIDEHGIVVMPITSLLLEQAAPTAFVSSGVPQLDRMLGGKGYFAGSSVLVSGGAGTGKTSLAASFVDRACRRGARALFFAFEESAAQIIRGMRSIGIDLKRWQDSGLLRFHCTRPVMWGLETHLTAMYKAVSDFDPGVVVVDPMTDLFAIGSKREIHAMLTRLVDFLKCGGRTTFMTGLRDQYEAESGAAGISSLIDTWIELRDVELGAERNRTLVVCKARGVAHSNQVREFLITAQGIQLVDVCVGPDGVITGSARLAQEARLRRVASARQRRSECLRRQLRWRKQVLEARIAALRAELEAEVYGLESSFSMEDERETQIAGERDAIARIRTLDGRGDRTPAGKAK